MPPTKSDLSELTELKELYGWRDITEWRDQMDIRNGIRFDEDGSIIFEEWPDRPHDQIVREFTLIFSSQFRTPYQNQAAIHLGNTIWPVPTALLYHPEPVPVLNPPLPASFDIERIRRVIYRKKAKSLGRVAGPSISISHF